MSCSCRSTPEGPQTQACTRSEDIFLPSAPLPVTVDRQQSFCMHFGATQFWRFAPAKPAQPWTSPLDDVSSAWLQLICRTALSALFLLGLSIHYITFACDVVLSVNSEVKVNALSALMMMFC